MWEKAGMEPLTLCHLAPLVSASSLQGICIA